LAAGMYQPQPYTDRSPWIGPISPRHDAAERSVAPWELPDRGTMVSEAIFPLAQPSKEAFVPPGTHPPLAPSRTAPISSSQANGNESDSASPRVPTPAELNTAFGTGKTAMQIQDSYLVLETSEGMLVIDQHALHERILFEQLRRRVRDGKLEVQRLLIPEPIDLPAEQAALVLEAADALRELGLEVSEFGGNTILLSSYPTILGRKPPHEIFKGVVDYLLNKERPPTKDAMLHLLMATMACKAAVKAGDRLTPEEIAHLLHLRQLAEDSHHCPHGRPTSLLFSRQELDKQFRRT
jgi:DNA mismatch repair protein MutL